MWLTPRPNLALAKTEKWRPPPFVPPTTPWRRFLAHVRRLFDLQAASLWKDLAEVLPTLTGRVLDVGCGAQPFRGLLLPQATYVGIDTADAKERFGYAEPDTLFFQGDTWPVEDGSCAAVLCTETLEHVAEPDAFLREMHRCLDSGGQLVLTVPFAARWHYVPHDYWRFTPSSLRLLLERNGFLGVAVYARGNSVTVACYKAMALLLPLVAPQTDSTPVRWAMRAAGFFWAPVFFGLALLGHVSLRFPGGEDCLGYTVFATRNSAQGQKEGA